MKQVWMFSVVLLVSALGLPAQVSVTGMEIDLTGLSRTLRKLAAEAGPAVVQIEATSFVPVEGGLLPSAAQLVRQQKSGSGVILDQKGYLVTNAHVVERARRIQVWLAAPEEGSAPGQSILRPRGPRLDAQLVGVDRETDLAVLKIEGTEPLPFVEFGDSDDLRTGDLVLALGSPLGLANSVTLGIVSATARQLRPEDPMIYIQTDAPINPGNSGGALVNMRGELVGINTLILSRSGGSEGIGFAAPSNIVRHIYEQIRGHGQVQRGELGVITQTITPDLAVGLGLARGWGVILADVEPGGPGADAGLAVGDIVLKLDGKVMENGRQFDVNVYQRDPGETVKVDVLRGTERRSFLVRVRLRETGDDQFLHLANPEENLVPEMGIMALDITPVVARMLPPPRKVGGVVVAARTLQASGAGEGFLPGDVIYEINGRLVVGVGGLRKALEQRQAGQPVVVQIQRGQWLRYLTVSLD